MKLSTICWLLTFIFCTFDVNAEQIMFNKVKHQANYKFEYQWQDYQGVKREISFLLPSESILNKFRNFKTYQPAMTQQWVRKSLQKHFRKAPIEGVTLKFPRASFDGAVIIQGKNQSDVIKARQTLAKQQTEITKAYLDRIYYHTFTTHDNQEAIKPNHRKIAFESVDDLKPLKPIILESASIKNIRKVSNYVLGFIQTIPYAKLSSRVTSSGAGFNPPLKLLWENQGDCDSKVTLTASLLRTLMPRIKIAMIYIENHALIGIDIPPMGDEVYITHNGTKYLLAEPTGPAVVPLGVLAPDSKQAVLSGHFSIEEFHAIVEQEATN